MSFRCQNCGKALPQYFKGTKVITEIRSVNYPSRVYHQGRKKVEDPGGQGVQIVKELLTCGTCMAGVVPVDVSEKETLVAFGNKLSDLPPAPAPETRTAFRRPKN